LIATARNRTVGHGRIRPGGRLIGDVGLTGTYARSAERTGERIATRADERSPS
jgi:hypothetical protein